MTKTVKNNTASAKGTIIITIVVYIPRSKPRKHLKIDKKSI